MRDDENSELPALARKIRGSPLAAVLEQNPDGVLLVSKGFVAYANPAFAVWLGRAETNDLPGIRLLELVHADDRDSVASRVFGGEKPAHRSYRFLTRWGDPLPIELVHTGRIELEGATLEVVIGRDVTEQRRAAATMLLSDRMLSVGALAAGVAHEINNPLSYVIGNLSFIAEEVPQLLQRAGAADADGKDLVEALEEARQGAERVRTIVRDLQAFSRADHQSSPSIDVRRTCELAINMAWIEIRHRARLIKDFAEVPLVEASEARLGQAFLSLLIEAAHALPEGGADKYQLRVATRVAAAPGRHVIVEISHNGPSPSRDELAQAFDPFSAKGLGLAIAHSIVTELGGQLTVSEAVPRGTRFTVELVPASMLQATRAKAAAASSARGRVLVVDDEPLLASSIRRALRDHDVTVVESGRGAIQALAGGEVEFDLVLLDLMMPEMTGMDVYDWLRGAHPGAEDRIVFMTGGTFTPRANEFLRAVKNHRFEKPFEMEQIREYVRIYIQKART